MACVVSHQKQSQFASGWRRSTECRPRHDMRCFWCVVLRQSLGQSKIFLTYISISLKFFKETVKLAFSLSFSIYYMNPMSSCVSSFSFAEVIKTRYTRCDSHHVREHNGMTRQPNINPALFVSLHDITTKKPHYLKLHVFPVVVKRSKGLVLYDVGELAHIYHV